MLIGRMANRGNKQVMVFDLDNTLIDSGAKLTADIVGAFARLGHKVTQEEIARYKSWYEHAEAYGISKEIFDESFNKRKTWEQSLFDEEVPIFPETYNVLENLKRKNIRLSLLSKSLPEYTNLKLGYFNLNKYFEKVIAIHPEKPSKLPGAIEIMEEFNPSSINESYFVGDKEEDVSISRDISKKYGFSSGGIYINREGDKLDGYKNIKFLNELLEIV